MPVAPKLTPLKVIRLSWHDGGPPGLRARKMMHFCTPSNCPSKNLWHLWISRVTKCNQRIGVPESTVTWSSSHHRAFLHQLIGDGDHGKGWIPHQVAPQPLKQRWEEESRQHRECFRWFIWFYIDVLVSLSTSNLEPFFFSTRSLSGYIDGNPIDIR